MPEQKQAGTTFIGKCNFRGNARVFGIKTKDRRQHMYVIGQTGTGKTTLLKNLVLQDIRAGRGVAIIDPHGEFVEEVLEQIPVERTEDVIYFNPVDVDYPIGFNVLEVPDVKYKHLIASDLLGIFTKIWANVWSARMEYILQNCILALIDTPGTTLLGIPRILVDKDYREKIIANVKDPVVRSFWLHEYETWRDQFRSEAIVPIQNKVGQFLNTSFIRNIVGQETSTINISRIMNEGKILLANVSKGRIGEDNSQLLGAMLITKIQLAAMERVRILEEEREDFYLYVDEFQNFATDSFANILSEARKYRLNLIIAHQYIGQLVTDVSTKVRDAVFGNVGTLITFRVGAPDAEFLETQFMPEFQQADLIGLPNHHIYLRLMVDGITSRPFSSATLPSLKFETDMGTKEKIIRASREKYARPREKVEQDIAQWSGVAQDGDGRSFGGTKMFDATCWNCAKETTVPFQPDGKRPVYCLNCFKQIDEGKLIPLPDRMPRDKQARFSSSLEEMGIEFPVSERKKSVPSGNAHHMHVLPTAPRPHSEAVRASLPAGEVTEGSRAVWSGRRESIRLNRRKDANAAHGKENMRRDPYRPQPVVRIISREKPLPLSALQPRDRVKKEKTENDHERETSQRPNIDLSGLKKALDAAMQERDEVKKAESEPVIDPALHIKQDKKEKVMSPGDAVML